MIHPQTSRQGPVAAIAAVAFVATGVACFTAHADIVYRETYGRPAVNSNIGTTNYGWIRFNAAGTLTTLNSGINGGGAAGTQLGRPTDVANVNAGPNSDGTSGAYTTGWQFLDGTSRLSYTPEYTLDPANYVPGSLVFSWYQGNAALGQGFQVVVRVGGVWYASAQVFDNSVIFTADTFGTGAELKSFTYNPAAATWLALNFTGNYDPVNQTTTASGAISLGAAAGSDLAGPITAFGLYRNVTGSNGRFDTYQIDGIPTNNVVPIVGTNIWTAASNNDWDLTRTNWMTPDAVPTSYADNSLVILDDSAASGYVNLATNLFPGGIVVSNPTLPYTFTGIGALGGSGKLTKLGAGTLFIENSGSNTFPGGVNIDAGTIQVGTGGASGNLPALGNITNHGALVAARTGSLTIGNLISGTGSVVNIGTGTLTLSGGNNYAGGLTLNAGTVRLVGGAAAGTGVTLVKPNTALVAGGAHNNPITLSNGTLGGISGIASIPGQLTAGDATTSLIYVSDPQNLAVNSEMIFTGTLRGGGNLIGVAGTNNINPDGGVGLRFRGTAAGDFTGTITISNNVKGELQTTVAGPFSPANTGKVVLVCGAYVGTNGVIAPTTGGYSEFNLRNNSGGSTTLGNDVELTGSGLANLNPLGSAPAGSAVVMGNLRIGAGQELGVYLGAAPAHVVTFQSVTLKGGLARFSPKTPDFGTVASVGSDLTLNGVSESVPGSGFIMNGLRILTLTGISDYTGSTIVSNGTLLLKGSLAGGGPVRVDGGKLAGEGAISGSLTVNPGGTIAPEGQGSPAGFIEVDGDVTLSGITAMDLNKTGVGLGSDIIGFSATMNFGGTLQLNVVGGTLSAGEEFALFSFQTGVGSFASIVPPSPGPGLAWDTSTLYGAGVLRVVAGSLPSHIDISTSGTDVILSGTNGTPHSLYRVLTSTEITMPRVDWTPIHTNTLSGAGNFTFTNALNFVEPRRFFILDLP